MKYEDIEFLFNYVGSAPRFEHSAYLNLRTGEGYITSELGDSDELPDDFAFRYAHRDARAKLMDLVLQSC